MGSAIVKIRNEDHNEKKKQLKQKFNNGVDGMDIQCMNKWENTSFGFIFVNYQVQLFEYS